LTGKIWATRIISTLWQHCFEGWDLHNTHVHGNNKKTADLDLRRRIISKVYHLHSRRNEVLADHVDYLFLSDLKQTIRTATLNFLRNWIHLYEPSILKSIRVGRSNAVKNTHSLCQYFRALSSNRPPKPRFDERHRLLIDLALGPIRLPKLAAKFSPPPLFPISAIRTRPFVEIQYLAPLSFCYSFTVAQVNVKGSTRNVSLVTFSFRFN
jgi:hypothetical protein